MSTLSTSSPVPNRRQFLTLVGAATLTSGAGCTGDAAPSTTANDPTDTDTADAEPEASCTDLDGPSTPLTPGDRQFPMLFEYPDTFEEYNTNINESSSTIGAQLGHTASAETNSYPVNIGIHQNKYVTTDPEITSNWVTSFGTEDRIDWTFTYQGETIEVYGTMLDEDETSISWRFLLPVADPEGVRPIRVQFADGRSEAACFEALTAIVQAVIETLTPNPDWNQPTTS